jgi:hypothetical protein
MSHVNENFTARICMTVVSVGANASMSHAAYPIVPRQMFLKRNMPMRFILVRNSSWPLEVKFVAGCVAVEVMVVEDEMRQECDPRMSR